MKPVFAPPHDPATFEQCKLDLSERDRHAAIYQLTKDLLKLRREDPVFKTQSPRKVDGAVLTEHAFILRYFADDGMDRLLVVNLGRDLHFNPCPEPLLAPPQSSRWTSHSLDRGSKVRWQRHRANRYRRRRLADRRRSGYSVGAGSGR